MLITSLNKTPMNHHTTVKPLRICGNSFSLWLQMRLEGMFSSPLSGEEHKHGHSSVLLWEQEFSPGVPQCMVTVSPPAGVTARWCLSFAKGVWSLWSGVGASPGNLGCGCCSQARNSSPPSLPKHRRELGWTGGAPATKWGSLGGGWDHREEYCLCRAVSMGAQLGTVTQYLEGQAGEGNHQSVVQRILVTVSGFQCHHVQVSQLSCSG